MMKMIPLEIQKESLSPRFESTSLYSLLQYSVLAIGIAFLLASCDGSTTSDKYTIDEWNSDNLWLTQQLGTSAIEEGRGVATDSSGNVYITGYTAGGLDGNTNAGGDDLFVVKYNSSGTKQWTRQLGSSVNDHARCIATDSSGNVFVGGSTYGGLDNYTNSGGINYFVVKYNSSGTKQWTQQDNTTYPAYANGVATDSSGNVYVAVQGPSKIVKYNSSGTKQWTQALSSGSSTTGDPYAIATDSSDNVYVTGSTTDNFTGNTNAGRNDIFVVKYNSSGDKQWTKQIGTTCQDYGKGIATDISGNSYVVGSTEVYSGCESGSTSIPDGLDNETIVGSNGGLDAFIIKYNSSGDKQWTRLFGSSDRETAFGVATDSSGNVYVVGETMGDMDGGGKAVSWDVFVVKYNSSGTKLWTRQLGSCSSAPCSGSGDSGDHAYGVALDSSRSRVYIAGSVYGDLDGNTLAGYQDAFLTRTWTLDF